MIYTSDKEIIQIFESNIYKYKSHAGINPINGHPHQECFLRSLAPKPDQISRQHGLGPLRLGLTFFCRRKLVTMKVIPSSLLWLWFNKNER